VSPLDSVRKVIGGVDNFQRRHRWVGVPYAVQKKFGDDNANLLVVALGWYGFTSIFPLLLVVVTVLGKIGVGSLGTGIVSTLHQFPVIGTSFPTGTTGGQKLHGSWFAFIVGVVGLVYGAQGVTQTAQQAMATVWDIPKTERTGFLPRLGRSIAGLITIGLAFLINAFVTTYVNSARSFLIGVPVIIGLVIINTLLYFATFYLLTPKVVGPRGLIPGAILGGIAFTALLTVGTGLMAHELKNADNTYGTFAGVIGIVVVLLLLAKLSLYAALLNPVLSRNLYPRALPMIKDLTEEDKRVLAGEVYQEQAVDDQAIGVGFGDNAAAEAAADARKRDPGGDGQKPDQDGQEPAQGRPTDGDGQADEDSPADADDQATEQDGHTSPLGRLRRLAGRR
jgi:uncharacterized BrkB/YihY/UPF0761 family membrane protein